MNKTKAALAAITLGVAVLGFTPTITSAHGNGGGDDCKVEVEHRDETWHHGDDDDCSTTTTPTTEPTRDTDPVVTVPDCERSWTQPGCVTPTTMVDHHHPGNGPTTDPVVVNVPVAVPPTVTATATVDTPVAPAAATLPRTGSPATTTALLALLVLLTGAVLTGLTMRRPNRRRA